MPAKSRMGSMSSKLYELVPRIKLPVRIMVGNAAADGQRGRLLHEPISSKDKMLKPYEGLRHEVINELEHPQVMADLEQWLEAH